MRGAAPLKMYARAGRDVLGGGVTVDRSVPVRGTACFVSSEMARKAVSGTFYARFYMSVL